MLPKPQPITDPGKIIDPRQGPGHIDHPGQGPDNRPIFQRPIEGDNHRVLPPQDHRLDPMRNRGIEDQIRREHQGWDDNDRGYHWRDWDGYQLCHHYDGQFHWWGFYLADVYFWSVYRDDHFWWYDPYWHRWDYLRDGMWWWQDPARVETVYVYRDGAYYQYRDSVGGVVLDPDPTPPVDAPPADPVPAPVPAPDAKSFYSADGTRVVQVSGDNKDAFLSDTADPPAFEPRWLASGVAEVRFKLDDQGRLVTIMTLGEDDGFNLFDQDGNPETIQPAPAPVAPVPAPGEGLGDYGTDTSSFGQSLQKSAIFEALRTGSLNW